MEDDKCPLIIHGRWSLMTWQVDHFEASPTYSSTRLNLDSSLGVLKKGIQDESIVHLRLDISNEEPNITRTELAVGDTGLWFTQVNGFGLRTQHFNLRIISYAPLVGGCEGALFTFYQRRAWGVSKQKWNLLQPKVTVDLIVASIYAKHVSKFFDPNCNEICFTPGGSSHFTQQVYSHSPLLPKIGSGSTSALRRPHSRPLSRWKWDRRFSKKYLA